MSEIYKKCKICGAEAAREVETGYYFCLDHMRDFALKNIEEIERLKERTIRLRSNADEAQAARLAALAEAAALESAINTATHNIDGVDPLEALTRLYALKRAADALKGDME